MELAIIVLLWTVAVSTALLTIFVGNFISSKTELNKAQAASERNNIL